MSTYESKDSSRKKIRRALNELCEEEGTFYGNSFRVLLHAYSDDERARWSRRDFTTKMRSFSESLRKTLTSESDKSTLPQYCKVLSAVPEQILPNHRAPCHWIVFTTEPKLVDILTSLDDLLRSVKSSTSGKTDPKIFELYMLLYLQRHGSRRLLLVAEQRLESLKDRSTNWFPSYRNAPWKNYRRELLTDLRNHPDRVIRSLALDPESVWNRLNDRIAAQEARNCNAYLDSLIPNHASRQWPSTCYHSEIAQRIAEFCIDEDEQSILWLCGGSGTGKSTIIDTSLRHLHEIGPKTPWFSVHRTDYVRQDPSSILLSWANQISPSRTNAPGFHTPTTMQGVARLFRGALADAKQDRKPTLILDGLDHICGDEPDIRFFCEFMRSGAESGDFRFVFSSPKSERAFCMASAPTIEIEEQPSHVNALNRYIHDFAEEFHFDPFSLETIIKKCSGSYYYLDFLIRNRHLDWVSRLEVDELPDGIVVLWERLWQDIANLGEGAARTLHTLIALKHPLSIDDLCGICGTKFMAVEPVVSKLRHVLDLCNVQGGNIYPTNRIAGFRYVDFADYVATTKIDSIEWNELNTSIVNYYKLHAPIGLTELDLDLAKVCHLYLLHAGQPEHLLNILVETRKQESTNLPALDASDWQEKIHSCIKHFESPVDAGERLHMLLCIACAYSEPRHSYPCDEGISRTLALCGQADLALNILKHAPLEWRRINCLGQVGLALLAQEKSITHVLEKLDKELQELDEYPDHLDGNWVPLSELYAWSGDIDKALHLLEQIPTPYYGNEAILGIVRHIDESQHADLMDRLRQKYLENLRSSVLYESTVSQLVAYAVTFLNSDEPAFRDFLSSSECGWILNQVGIHFYLDLFRACARYDLELIAGECLSTVMDLDTHGDLTEEIDLVIAELYARGEVETSSALVDIFLSSNRAPSTLTAFNALVRLGEEPLEKTVSALLEENGEYTSSDRILLITRQAITSQKNWLVDEITQMWESLGNSYWKTLHLRCAYEALAEANNPIDAIRYLDLATEHSAASPFESEDILVLLCVLSSFAYHTKNTKLKAQVDELFKPHVEQGVASEIFGFVSLLDEKRLESMLLAHSLKHAKSPLALIETLHSEMLVVDSVQHSFREAALISIDFLNIEEHKSIQILALSGYSPLLKLTTHAKLLDALRARRSGEPLLYDSLCIFANAFDFTSEEKEELTKSMQHLEGAELFLFESLMLDVTRMALDFEDLKHSAIESRLRTLIELLQENVDLVSRDVVVVVMNLAARCSEWGLLKTLNSLWPVSGHKSFMIVSQRLLKSREHLHGICKVLGASALFPGDLDDRRTIRVLMDYGMSSVLPEMIQSSDKKSAIGENLMSFGLLSRRCQFDCSVTDILKRLNGFPNQMNFLSGYFMGREKVTQDELDVALNVGRQIVGAPKYRDELTDIALAFLLALGFKEGFLWQDYPETELLDCKILVFYPAIILDAPMEENVSLVSRWLEINAEKIEALGIEI